MKIKNELLISCGHCGQQFVGNSGAEGYSCLFCGYESEACDFPDVEDVVCFSQCGCYTREGYNAGDPPYIVFCSKHHAAPELLEACKLVLRLWGNKPETGMVRTPSGRLMGDALIAAITKAEGK